MVPGLEREFGSLGRLDAAPEDVLLFHYSAYAPRLEEQLARPQRKVLVYHNVTPAHWFWDVEPVTAVECAIGREHLPRFARAAALAIGVSGFNARELEEAGAPRTAVVPNLVDLGAPEAHEPGGDPRWLFVGRLVPHKRPDLLVRALAAYRAAHGVDARLTWVGTPISPPYLEAMRAFGERVAPGAVAFEQDLPAAALAERWRSAHVFTCASEHEGFCIPLLEAFHHGVPVVARAFAGVPEVAGDAALVLAPRDGPGVLAEAAHLAAGDPGLRAALRERGRARLAAYAPEETASRLRSALSAL